MLALKRSRFTEWMVRENSLDASGFLEWFFYPGMLFNEMDKWWGNGGKRECPHEGVDFCFYKTRENNILGLDETAKIPAMYDGFIVRIMDDFIAKSVVVVHHFAEKDSAKFCTIYGHTIPLPHLTEGRGVVEGEVLATLATPGKSQSNIPPHLHLSVGWILDPISYKNLEWKSIRKIKALNWIDPLQMI